MAAIQTCALITVLMGFLASTTFNQEFFRHRIIIIHCVLILLLLESRRLLQRENRGNQRRFWVRPIFTARKTYGCYHTLVQELRLGDREWYFKFIRMSPERFEHLLSLVAPRISKQKTKLREPIGPAERLCITLRYLASGDSQQTQSFHFRVGKATVSKIIAETCNAIWLCLKEDYLKPPRTREQWKRIATEFEQLWGFPHCLGAGDGKHVVIDCPKKGGSTYFNYKGTFSILLLAYCDARYQFTLVDIGQFGSQNDSGTYNDSLISSALENNTLNLPPAEDLDGCTLKPLPYVFVVDEGLPLTSFQMRPWPGRNLSEDHAIFNYRLSRARRIIENCFGILAARWRVFRRPIRASVYLVQKIIEAAVCLHNYLRLTDNAMYCPQGFVDCEDSSGRLQQGEWRNIVAGDVGAFRTMETPRGRPQIDAALTRQALTSYFLTDQGSLPWQWQHVRSTGPVPTQ